MAKLESAEKIKFYFHDIQTEEILNNGWAFRIKIYQIIPHLIFIFVLLLSIAGTIVHLVIGVIIGYILASPFGMIINSLRPKCGFCQCRMEKYSSGKGYVYWYACHLCRYKVLINFSDDG